MFKQRDNEYHAPMTADPSGKGVVISAALTAATSDPFLNGSNGDNGNASGVAGGSRKRGRDIRGLSRFRTVVYGEDGFRRLHAMVARNPILMYPPTDIEEARARVAQRKLEHQHQQQNEQQQQQPGAHHPRRPGEEDDDVFALFEERKAAEATDASPTAVEESVSASAAAHRRDEELARYHHQQLDSYLRLLYEFNHVTFVKLPMEDTLQLLSRCGKDAVAHVIEYETHLRLQRQARVKELTDLQEEKAALAARRHAADEAEQARLLADAEQRQAQLELLGDAFLTAAPEVQEPFTDTTDTPERLSAPQVRFALDELVKEEDEMKDVETVEVTMDMTSAQLLPLVRDEGADAHMNGAIDDTAHLRVASEAAPSSVGDGLDGVSSINAAITAPPGSMAAEATMLAEDNVADSVRGSSPPR